MNITIHSSFLPQNDPDASLAFYRDTLGFEVRNDVGYKGMRWITVGPAGQPGISIVLYPPFATPGITDDERRTIAEMMAKGTYATIVLAIEGPRRHLRAAAGQRRRSRPGTDRPAVRGSRLRLPRSGGQPDADHGAALMAGVLKRDWRGEMVSRIRTLIEQADPEMIEERKWRKPSNGMTGVPVWSHDGIVCTGETYKNAVKMTFARGAELKDPSGLFNSSLDGNVRRAIDFHEGDQINERALKALIKAAVKLNVSDRA